jgi:hypothetical protein
MLDFCSAPTESADYSFGGIVIKRDPANHGNPGEGPRQERCDRVRIVT